MNKTPPRGHAAHHGDRVAGALVGSALAYGLARHLDVVPSSLLTSLVLAGVASLSGSLRRSPRGFWVLIGAACGALVGTAMVLAGRLQELDPQGDIRPRAVTLLLVAIAGVVAGLCLGEDAGRGDRHHPRDLIRSATGLTTGLFALLVTATFIHQGLDGARTFSSRLSTALTILATALVMPAWLAHLLQAALRSRAGSRIPPHPINPKGHESHQ